MVARGIIIALREEGISYNGLTETEKSIALKAIQNGESATLALQSTKPTKRS